MAVVDPRPFTVTTSVTFGRPIVAVHGELDVASGPVLSTSLRALIEEQGRVDVVVDLAELEFIDSRGLSVLLEADRTLRERGGTLTLRAPRPHVRKVFEVMGLAEHFTLTEA